jgi:uncharacterized protein (TIGR02217 family)
MALQLLPSLRGLAWPVTRSPQFSSLPQEAVSGKDNPIQLWPFPRYHYEQTYSVLRISAGEFAQLMAFFNLAGGKAGAWLYNDPNDNAATDQIIGIGDGTRTQFGLVRNLGGAIEPVFAPAPAPVIKLNGAPTGAFILGTTGLITMSSPPGAGVQVSWTGTFYWVCRFDDDRIDFRQTMADFYDLQKLAFTTAVLSWA